MIYEDDLSPNIPDSLYTQWFQLSEIVDGVRMGPEVRFSDLRGWYIESEATAELARRAFAIAQGEQECREQAAQPEAQPTNIHQYKAVLADYEQKINAERREAERLRGLLASLASAAERVLVILTARFQNDYRANGMTDEGALETAQGLTIITGLRETIEAAKEIRNA